MASPDLDSPWLPSHCESFYESLNIGIEEASPAPADISPVLVASTSTLNCNKSIPEPPALPNKICKQTRYPQKPLCFSFVPKETRDTWDKLFTEGLGADIYIVTEDKSCIPAHASVLVAASPVLGNIVRQSRVKKGMKYLKIPGMPYDAVYTFIRFLYSSCYDEEEMKKFVLHLLVLSHTYAIPSLKRICVSILEQGWITKENVIDVLQLARNCDAPRLSLICASMVIRDFKSVSSTEGWKVMRRANPSLEQELVEAVIEAETRKQERARKLEEKNLYLELHEAMEALVHICRDGCRTIGPRDKALKGSQVACKFPACKGLESLLRHFSNCRTRVPGGCVHCKRMWQLLELHSRICHEPDSCKVPLCRHFKEKLQGQSKKDEAKWRLLVNKVAAAKNFLGPFSSRYSGFL